MKTKTLTMTEAVAIVKAGRVGQDAEGKLTVDGVTLRAPKLVRMLTDAAIANWVAG